MRRIRVCKPQAVLAEGAALCVVNRRVGRIECCGVAFFGGLSEVLIAGGDVEDGLCARPRSRRGMYFCMSIDWFIDELHKYQFLSSQVK